MIVNGHSAPAQSQTHDSLNCAIAVKSSENCAGSNLIGPPHESPKHDERMVLLHRREPVDPPLDVGRTQFEEPQFAEPEMPVEEIPVSIDVLGFSRLLASTRKAVNASFQVMDDGAFLPSVYSARHRFASSRAS
jgi:hypothetical protein